MEKAIPRPEYPRPQMVRSQWMNLNGPWEFEMDFGSSGRQRRWFESASFTKKLWCRFVRRAGFPVSARPILCPR